MEPNENPDEGLETSSAKVVFGIRVAPELKEALAEEAAEAGFLTSELGEMILANRHHNKRENERLTELVAVQQKEIETLKAQITAGVKQVEVAKAENTELRKKVEALSNQLSILSDQRLIYLFENLKGRKDTVENAYAEDFPISYDTPVQVLLALIYSSKLNT
jgi:hypothetical protein